MQAAVVQHNLQSMFTNRQLNITGKLKSKSTEKLSSGYRINRSADDAAGLAISEKMRWQVRGLNKASQNISDGISFVQTAEGYLGEVTDILHRMEELATQASNDTNTPEDRKQIDLEVQQLKKETKRIFKDAEYNTKKIWEVPYSPEPELLEEGTKITYKQRSTSLPNGVLLDPNTAEKGNLANTYTKGTTTYNAASFIDFSNADFSDLSKFDGKGFYSTCCTCDDHYSITFDSTTSSHNVSGTQHYTYSVGIQGCTSAADIVNRIVAATGGNPNNHFTNYEVSNTDPTGSTLVIYDNRPNQKPYNDTGKVGTGVTYEEKETATGPDFFVFNRGVDANGNPLYGGVEINDVRHTWEEMGIELNSDGRTFRDDQEAVFYDYTGERVHIKVKDGEEAPEISRNYQWDAREDGIYINNVFATDWESLGIKETGNSGRYSFNFRNMGLEFLVNEGDSLEDVKDGINGKVLDKKYSWDMNVGDVKSDTALTVTENSSFRATNDNKGFFDATYAVKADESGITLVDSTSRQHTFVSWKDFIDTDKENASDPDYPISDWGINDKDGKGKKSNLITFDDTAVYTYTDNKQPNLPISFSFKLADETGLATVIQELNNAKLKAKVDAPHSTTAAAAASSRIKVSVTDKMDYATQRAYGRDFDDPNWSTNGKVNRILVTGAEVSNESGDENVVKIDGTKTKTGSREVFISDGEGCYYKYTENAYKWDRTTNRDLVNEIQNNANYKYTGNFAGNTMNEINGSSFMLQTVITKEQNSIDEVKKNVYTDDPTGKKYTEEEVNDYINDHGGAIIESKDAEEHLTEKQDWVTTKTTKIKNGANNKDTVPVTTSKGTAMVLTVNNDVRDVSDTVIDLSFKATGYATRDFDVILNGKNNTGKTSVITDVTANLPKRVINIQAGALGLQGIPIEWEGLNNTVLGIAQTHVRDYKHAQKAMAQANKALEIVTTQRSKWGAYQNRLEHSKLIDDNTAENSQAAESRIRDLDMAAGVAEDSKNNILQQAGQAMLTQANQSTQGVLTLIR